MLEAGISRWQRSENSERTFSHEHNKSMATYGIISLEKVLKTWWTVPPQKG